MPEHKHAIIWIDHQEARVFHFSANDVEKLSIHPANKHVHIHHKANSNGSGHADEDKKFLADVAEAVGAAQAVLIVGPAGEKTTFMKYLASHEPRRHAAVRGVETMARLTDGQLIAHARKFFEIDDRKTPQA